jgi:hypothetical protein
MWIKKSLIQSSGEQYFSISSNEHSGAHNDGIAAMYFSGGEQLHTYFDTSGTAPYGAINSRLYRDPAGWMQIIWAVDAANTTQRIWINGVEESASSSLNPPDYAYAMNKSGHRMAIGTPAWGVGSSCFDGYMAQVVHLDGQYITDPTEFGQVSSTSGEWEPIEITSSSFTYGTNGALLEFLETGTGTPSSSTIGADTSGKDNHWSTVNLAAEDIVEDTPTDNYCVLNPLDSNSNNVLSEGNLNFSSSGSSGHYPTFSTMGMRSGKWYWESCRENGDGWIMAIMSLAHDGGSLSIDSTVGNSTSSVNKVGYSISASTGNKSHDSGAEYNQAYGLGIGLGGVLMCAFDADNGKIWWGRDGTWFDSGDPAAGTDYAFTGIDTDTDWGVCIHGYSGHLPWMNFGADPTFGGNVSTPDTSEFKHTPPTGFKALKSSNLTASIAKPAEYFDVLTYASSGAKTFDNGSTSMQPDLVWVKARGNTYDHELTDSVRGVTKALSTNDDGLQSTDSTGLIDFDADGFEVGAGTNYSTSAMVAWCWRKHITSGFDIVEYTADDTGGTKEITLTSGFGTPEMVIVKAYDEDSEYAGDTTTNDWYVWHHKLTDEGYYILLNGTAGEVEFDDSMGGDDLINVGNGTVTVGGDAMSGPYLNEYDSMNSDTGRKYIIYAMKSVAGFSRVGSFSGSSSAFIYTDFRPSFILAKRYDSTGGWLMFDDKREGYNVDNDALEADTSAIEATTDHIDILSNGFRIRTSDSDLNAGTVIYYAVGQSSKYSNAR